MSIVDVFYTTNIIFNYKQTIDIYWKKLYTISIMMQ